VKTAVDQDKLAQQIKAWGQAFGFQQVGISDTNLEEAGAHLNAWLDNQFHGDMDYMHKHGSKRYRPEELEPGTYRIISVRMDYAPGGITPYEDLLAQPDKAAISRYALGRDYHKVLRKRLQQLAKKIEAEVGAFGYRVFTDSAPVMEKAIAEKAGLGWIGKHSNVLNAKAGSWFFLGEIYTDLDLPVDEKASFHCGSCRRCLDACPTQAIVAPFKVDARRCISYLTIENHGPIPVEFRAAMGNRIYGCDDCQMVCPWNKFASPSAETDFSPRHQLDDIDLLSLFDWDEETFLRNTEGSPIRRIGYQAWQRNIAVALGNSNGGAEIVAALQNKLNSASPMVREHIEWALDNLSAHA